MGTKAEAERVRAIQAIVGRDPEKIPWYKHVPIGLGNGNGKLDAANDPRRGLMHRAAPYGAAAHAAFLREQEQLNTALVIADRDREARRRELAEIHPTGRWHVNDCIRRLKEEICGYSLVSSPSPNGTNGRHIPPPCSNGDGADD